MRKLGIGDVPTLHRWSVDRHEDFLRLSIERLGTRFRTPPTKMLDASAGPKRPRWLVGAAMNVAESCFTAPPDATAIVFSKPDGSLGRWTYRELRSRANRVSNGLVRAGFASGDAIAVLMPMTPESVAIYLGVVQAGCAVIGIADSFAPPEIALRLRIANAKGVFTVDRFVRSGKPTPMYEKLLLAEAGRPRAIVLSESPVSLKEGDLSWTSFLSDNDSFTPVPFGPEDPINILFSSGTTGEPKAIPFDQCSALKCAIDAHWHHDLHERDVVAWPTSLGWMMGPWLIFAALMNRATIALHCDAALDRAFGQFVQNAGVNMLGLVPSLVRRWRETKCMEGLDWSRVQTFSSTGECSNPDDMLYLMRLAGMKPIIEYCGGTEISGGFITSTVVQPNIPSTFSTKALGNDLVILDENGKEADFGELFLIPPAFGLSRRLLNRDHDAVYFDGTPTLPDGRILRRHGDQFERLANGYFRALGRADDTMNLGGIKVSSAEIERAMEGTPGVKETAAVATNPPGGGPSRLVVFAVAPGKKSEEILTALQQAVRTKLNPLFKIYEVVVVESLPRTASQKVMRRELRKSYEGSKKDQTL